MSSLWSRKDKNVIPPVDDSHSSNGRPAFPTSNSDLRTRAGTGAAPSRYQDVYSRGERDIEKDRGELFAGYDREKHSAGGNRFRDAATPAHIPDVEEDDDVEAIKTKTRFTKQESVNSTRNALRIAREAEETAKNTLLRLGDQSEKIANTERHLDVAKGHSNRAEDKTDELKQLNRSIFRPVITMNKEAKRRAQEEKLANRWEEEKTERERSMGDIRASQNRLGSAGVYGGENEEETITTDGPGSRRNRFRTAEQQATRKVERSRYQVDATASDDELEDEIDDNLDEIGEAAARLKNLGIAMGHEVDSQNARLERLDGKVGRLDMKITNNTERLKRIK